MRRNVFLGTDKKTTLIENGVLISVSDKDIIDGKFIIPEGVKKIGERAFAGCKKLKQVKLPEGLKVIENHAFSRCENLEEITIPESVTDICDCAFEYCSQMKKVECTKGLETIGIGAFWACKKMEDITISTNTNVGSHTFETSALKHLCFIEVEEELEKRNISERSKATIREQLKDHAFRRDHREDAEKIGKWLDKGITPLWEVFTKIPADKIASFDKKIWVKLAKNPIFNETPEGKSALVELVYIFGLFDKDKVEVRGALRNEKVNGVGDDFEKRARKILELIEERKNNGRKYSCYV